jgi:hypothetical protein
MGALTLTKPVMTDTAIIEAIKAKAIVLWGDRWLTEITRKWNELYHPDGDTTEAYRNKRPQLGRTFDAGTATLATVVRLAQCVELELTIG